MTLDRRFLRSFIVVFLCLGVFGCATTLPRGFLKPSEDNLQKRALQMRQYDTTDQIKIITSVAGVLQDLGFTLDDSETEVGFVAASKNADATSGGQIATAVIFDVLFGSNTASQCDKSQKIRASVITKHSLDAKKTVVRVTFQRVVWNMSNQISRVETINDPQIYQKFFDSLSKAIFLEAQQI